MKRLIPFVALVFVIACHTAPNLTPQGARAQQANAVTTALTALSQTAIALNAIPAGQPGHLTDANTRIVRDFALSVSEGLTDYVASGGTAAIVTAVTSFSTRLAQDAKINPTLRAVWAVVQIQLAIFLPNLVNPFGGG